MSLTRVMLEGQNGDGECSPRNRGFELSECLIIGKKNEDSWRDKTGTSPGCWKDGTETGDVKPILCGLWSGKEPFCSIINTENVILGLIVGGIERR